MRKILLTGKNGQIGWELQRTLASLGDIVAVGHLDMDLVDPDPIRKVIREFRPVLIVNAAYTAVDKAESEPELAMAVNGVAPGIMAEEAKRLNAAIIHYSTIHYSTDYVFDGTGKRPYVEDGAPNPINVYGKSKLAGERAIQAAGVPHLILRTSWVYGARGKNFLRTILSLARERSELKIVDDQVGAPTWSRLLAEVTSQMLSQHYSPFCRSSSLADVSGLYHVVSGGSAISWYSFAKKILENIGHRVSHALPKLISIATTDYPLPAKRPQNSGMSCEKLMQVYGLQVPFWDDSLALCLNEMATSSTIIEVA